MRYARIDGVIVVDVVLAGENWASPDGEIYVPDPSGAAQIGGSWDGLHFAPPPAPSEPVPERADMWQARAALRFAGIYEAADAAILASGNPALIEAWTNGNSFRRDSPAIAQLGQMLGLNSGQIDGLFIAAAGISV